MSSIKFVCSLGSLCHSAFLLKNNKLKLASYPFDWIHSYPNMICHAISDDFKTFLNKDYYSSTDKNSKQQSHLFYYPQLKNMFRHHNPIIEEDYNYFVRCIERFRDLLKSKENKLFIYMEVNNEESLQEKNICSVKRFNNFLQKYTSNYTLLYVHHSTSSSRSHTFTKFENIDLLDLITCSRSDGVVFTHNDDNIFINKIFTDNYTFDLIPITKEPEKRDL
jgi:hypothetical protein